MENFKPRVYNLFKPASISSYDCIRFLKRSFPKDKKLKFGHFGTLDPFACGVLLIGVGGGAKINDYIHSSFSKTYLAIGKLGLKTDSGDITGQIISHDNSSYLHQSISQFSKEFIEKQLQDKFLGEYFQAPPAFSASKFNGKPLHQWAREGVTIKKDEIKRQVHSIEVIRYQFPFLSIRFEVSSGTYIRTLFEECCQWIGTVGVLIGLVREKIGPHSIYNSLRFSANEIGDLKKIDYFSMPLDVALPLPSICLDEWNAKHYRNGLARKLLEKEIDGLRWVYHGDELLGLGKVLNQTLGIVFNLSVKS